jgi:predicted negative regulator of RcsB-dependent stress response
MLFEDYVLRQISLLVAVLAKIAGLKQAGSYQQAYKMIDQTIEETLGLNATIVKQLDDASLMELLSTENGLDLGRIFVLAGLLEAEGDLLLAQHRSQASRERYQHALNLLMELSGRSIPGLEKEIPTKINALQMKLAFQD